MLHDLINVLNWQSEEPKKSKVEVDDDYDLKDEAKRLKMEMEITMRQVQESKFYAELYEQIRENQEFNQYLRSTMGSHSHVQMVVYALGSIEYSYHSQFQMAIAISVQRDFSNWIGEIEVYDPVLSPADRIVLQELGCIVLSINERCRRQVEKPTLFFMAYPNFHDVENLIAANWCPSKINQMIVLTNRMFEPKARPRMQYFEAIEKHTIEVKIPENFGIGTDNIFFNFAWHFFEVKPEIDMETLLPVDEPSKTARLEWSLEFDGEQELDCWPEKKWEEYFMDRFKDSDSDEDLSDFYAEHRGPRSFRCKSLPQPEGWIKLNVSGRGCDDRINSAGFGAVFYNDKKEPIAMISGNLEGGDDIAANLEALKQALKCLQSYMPPVKKLIVEGDNPSVMRWVNHSPKPPERIREALAEVHALMKNMKCVAHHIYEEANFLAIELANKGAQLQNLDIWISEEERK